MWNDAPPPAMPVHQHAEGHGGMSHTNGRHAHYSQSQQYATQHQPQPHHQQPAYSADDSFNQYAASSLAQTQFRQTMQAAQGQGQTALQPTPSTHSHSQSGAPHPLSHSVGSAGRFTQQTQGLQPYAHDGGESMHPTSSYAHHHQRPAHHHTQAQAHHAHAHAGHQSHRPHPPPLHLSSLNSSMRASELHSSHRYPGASPAHSPSPSPSPRSMTHPTQLQQQQAPPPHPTPSHAQQSTTGGDYDSRLHSLASTLLSRVVASISPASGGPGAVDASYAALSRDPSTHPFLVERLGELLRESLGAEREAQLRALGSELHSKDARLAALQAEHAAVAKQFALKESLLQERSEILRQELLAQKALAGSQEHQAVQALPRLQSQLSAAQSAAGESARLAERLSAELRARDSALESTSAKYDSLSEQFLQLKSVASALNERLLAQGSHMESVRAAAESKEREARQGAADLSQSSAARVQQLQAQLESAKHEAALASQASEARVRELESRLSAASEGATKAAAELEARVQALREEHKKEVEQRVREATQSAAHLREKLESELSAAHSAAAERAQAAEKAHAAELHYRTSDLSARLEQVQQSHRALADQLASAQLAKETEAREQGAEVSAAQTALQTLREEHARLQLAHETATKELGESRTKYASMGSTFQSALAEDETRFTQALEAERAKTASLKQRWAEDAARSARQLASLEERTKEAEGAVADQARHIKSQGDNLAASVEREHELQRKLQAARLEAESARALATRQEAESKALLERVAQQLREKEKALDKVTLERESESRRWAHEMELQLLQQKSQHAAERHAVDKELHDARAQATQAKAASEAALVAARAALEQEKQAWQREQTHAFEKRLLEAANAAPSQALFDAQLAHAVDARVAELQKTFLSPEAHAQILTARLEAAKLEAQRAALAHRAETESRAAEATRAAEERHKVQMESLRAKYEAEYGATMAQVKSGCREYEEEIATERSARNAAESAAKEAARAAADQRESAMAAQRALEEERSARTALAEHLEQSGRVIERLKSALQSERASSAEQHASRAASESEAARAREERHRESLESARAEAAAAVAAARSQAAAEALTLRTTFESLLKQEAEEAASRVAQARQQAESAAAQAQAEAKSARAAADAARLQLSEQSLSSAAQMHRAQLDAEGALEHARREATRAAAERDRQVESLRAQHAREKEEAARATQRVQEKLEEHTRREGALATQLAAAHRQLASVRSLQAELERTASSLRGQHTSLQQSVRKDLTELYGAASQGISAAHDTMQQQRRRLLDDEQTIAIMQNALAQQEAQLRETERAMQEASERAADEAAALRHQHLLELQLARGPQDETVALRTELESMRERMDALTALHAGQMARLRAEHAEEHRDQLRHMEDLLRLKGGAPPTHSPSKMQHERNELARRVEQREQMQKEQHEEEAHRDRSSVATTIQRDPPSPPSRSAQPSPRGNGPAPPTASSLENLHVDAFSSVSSHEVKFFAAHVEGRSDAAAGALKLDEAPSRDRAVTSPPPSASRPSFRPFHPSHTPPLQASAQAAGSQQRTPAPLFGNFAAFAGVPSARSSASPAAVALSPSPSLGFWSPSRAGSSASGAGSRAGSISEQELDAELQRSRANTRRLADGLEQQQAQLQQQHSQHSQQQRLPRDSALSVVDLDSHSPESTVSGGSLSAHQQRVAALLQRVRHVVDASEGGTSSAL